MSERSKQKKSKLPAQKKSDTLKLPISQTDPDGGLNLVKSAQQTTLFGVVAKIRDSLDLEDIFKSTTVEVRQLLKADRTAIYRFDDTLEFSNGEIISEDVLSPFTPALGAEIQDRCFGENHEQYYKQNRIWSCADIYQQGLSDCHMQLLERFEIKANLVVPLLKGDRLWGLLCIHQCSAPRQWQESEIDFVKKIAAHIDVALKQSELVMQIQAQSEQLGMAIQQSKLLGQVQKRSTELQTALEIELQKRADRLAKDAEQERALAKVIERIRQTLDIDTIFSATTEEVRQNLNCDRVVVYRFFDDWGGEFVFESKTDQWLSLEELADRNKIWVDTHLQENQGGRYINNHESFVINDIYNANLTECHVGILETYQVQAFMIAPVFVANKLWGLLAAYQNSGSRDWEASEIRLLTQVGNQLGVAVQQADLLVQLKKAKENADTANKAKGDFLAHMSHELRTPLNAILGFAQVLSRGEPLTSKQREHIGIITRSGEHLLTLLNDVLEMSKIEAGLIELNSKTCNFHVLLARLRDMFTLKAQAKNLQLIFEKDPDVPKYIHVDDSKLRQILINIIGNAIKFTEKGIVSLKVTYRDGSDDPEMNGYSSLFFEIADTGSGIAPEELDVLFQPFVQTTTGRRSQEGTGLGMAISKRFAKLMGGDIQVESTVAEGTVVKFDIKVQMAVANDLPVPLNRGDIALATDMSAYRILLTDDKYESRFLMRNLLAPLGFEIREANNGEEAVEIWRSWQPHLIWMDMQMPIMDGYEATRIIRASESLESTCKIIALTASVFDTQRSAMLALGCDDFVSKPIREDTIFEKIAEHLGVVYTYTENESQDSGSNQESSDLQQIINQDLNALERDWLLELDFAARAADEESIFQLLTQIQDAHPAIATLIQDLVNNFHLDQIINIIEPFINK